MGVLPSRKESAGPQHSACALHRGPPNDPAADTRDVGFPDHTLCVGKKMRRVLPLLFGLLVVPGCDSPSAPGIDYGQCTSSAPQTTTLAGLRFEIRAEPSVIEYQVSSDLTIHVTNTTADYIELGSSTTCLLEVWIRGESPIDETRHCHIFQVQLTAGGSSSYSTGVQFRPPGTPRRRFRSDPDTWYYGPAAPPATYCWVGSVTNGVDAVRLETSFELKAG